MAACTRSSGFAGNIKKTKASKSGMLKDAFALRVHHTPANSICQHPAQKKFFDLVYIDKFRKLEYNTINEQRRSWIGKVYPVGERLCFFIFVRKD
mgnify:FL=1